MTPYERALLHTLAEMAIRIAENVGLEETAADITVAHAKAILSEKDRTDEPCGCDHTGGDCDKYIPSSGELFGS